MLQTSYVTLLYQLPNILSASVLSAFTLRGILRAIHILKTVQKLSVEQWNNGASMQTNRSHNILLALVARLVCACVRPVNAEWQCAVWGKFANRSIE